MIQGGVNLQVLAVAAITGEDSAEVGREQVGLYQRLLQTHAEQVGTFDEFSLGSSKVHFLFAIENASAVLNENEPLELFFKRIEEYRSIEEILYISLTWNQENRFGGGNLTEVGLKNDGKTVLEYLDGKNIAVDLSHTSDTLAYDLLDLIEQKSLKIPVIASHSNYRSVQNIERNLPDPIAKEIIRRKGLIGLNFVHRFVGKSPTSFIAHIEHALALGGERAICLGADFYGGLDLSSDLCPGKTPITFFDGFSNSGCYPEWTNLLRKEFSKDLLQSICYGNVHRFLKSTR